MALTVRQALELEAAIYVEDFLQDLDRLLLATGASLHLGWHGKWAELAVKFAGDAEPRVFLRVCKKWPFARPVLEDPRAADFWERLRKVLALHRADIGVGICAGGVAKCQVSFPHAPKERPTDRDFAARLLMTTKGKVDSREVEGISA